MRRRYLSLCMAIALTLTSVFPYGATAEEVIPTPAVEAAEEAETADLSVNALDETEVPAAEAPTGEEAEAQEQEDAQASVNEEDAQTAAEEQTPMSAEDVQASEPAQIAVPEESFDEEEAIVSDEEELPQEEAAENMDVQDQAGAISLDMENSPITVENMEEVADPGLDPGLIDELAEEGDGENDNSPYDLQVAFSSGTNNMLPGDSNLLFVTFYNGDLEDPQIDLRGARFFNVSGGGETEESEEPVISFKYLEQDERTRPSVSALDSSQYGEMGVPEGAFAIELSSEGADCGNYPFQLTLELPGEGSWTYIGSTEEGNEPEIIVADDYWQVTLMGENSEAELDMEAINKMEPGDSVTVTPVVTNYFLNSEGETARESKDVTEEAYYQWNCFGEGCDPDGPALKITYGENQNVEDATKPVHAVSFTITKLHNCVASAWLDVYRKSDSTEDDPKWMTSTLEGLEFEEREYNIYAEDELYVYTNGEKTFRLYGDRAYGTEGCGSKAKLVWSVLDDDGNLISDAITFPKTMIFEDEEGAYCDVTIDGTKLNNVDGFTIHAELKITDCDDDLCSCDMLVHVRQLDIRYQDIPEEEYSVIPYEDWSIGSVMNVIVSDNEHEKDSIGLKVTDVSVEDKDHILEYEDVDGKGEMAVRQYDDGSWYVRALKQGDVKVTVTFVPYGVEEDSGITETKEFTLHVVGETYHIRVSNSEGFSNNRVGVDKELTIHTALYRNSYNIDMDNGDWDEPFEDYTITGIEIEDYETAEEGEEPCARAEVSPDGKNITVRGLTEGWANFRFKVSVNGKEFELPDACFHVDVWNEYYLIDPIEPFQVELGETLDIADLIEDKIRVYRYVNGEKDEEPLDNTKIAFYWNYDPDNGAWEDTTDREEGQESMPTKLTRISGDGTWAELVAANPENPEEEYDGLWLDFDGIWFDDFVFGRDNYTLFKGTPLELLPGGVPKELVKEGVGYFITYDLRDRDDNQIDDPEPYVTLETSQENAATAILNVSDNWEWNDEESSAKVCAYLWYGDKNNEENWIELGYAEAWINIQEEDYRLSFADMWLMLGKSIELEWDEAEKGYTAWVNVWNPEHPDGKLMKVMIDEITPDEGNAATVTVDKTDGLLRLTATGIGEGEWSADDPERNYRAIMHVTAHKASDSAFDPKDKNLDFALYCTDYMCNLEVWTEGTHADFEMLPTETLQLRTRLTEQEYSTEEGLLDPVERTDYKTLYRPLQEGIVEISDSGEVKAIRRDWVEIAVFAVRADYEGGLPEALFTKEENTWTNKEQAEIEAFNEAYLADCQIGIDITGMYYSLGVEEEKIYLAPGETTEITPILKCHSITNPDGSEAEGTYSYRCETDPGYLTATAEDGVVTLSAGNIRKEMETFDLIIVAIDERGNDTASIRVPVTICQHDMQETVKKAATCVAAGEAELVCSKCGYTETEEIPATGHTPGDWTTVSPATTEAPEKQQRTCTVCGTVIDERTVGEKLQPSTEAPSTPSTEAPSTPSTEATGTGSAQTPGTESAGAGSGTGAVQEPFIELNATSIPMKLKQSTKVIKVKMAEGDSIVSWESSNKKVVTVTKKGKIKAKKKGKATITVTLASGKTASFVVKVQKNKVTTKKVTGVTKKITLAKGKKYKLTPVLKPLTSQDKITYTSSNKKVATVDKKGNIQAKGKGTAKITVKSGKKKAICTVTVK